MTHALDAPCFADRAVQVSAPIVENTRLARDTYRVRLECPSIARRIAPGQFFMVRLAGWNDPLLGRPLALYDTVLSAAGEPIGVDLVYLVQGKMTRKLADARPGQSLDLWGPLGNGFFCQPVDQHMEHLVMVAGGIGQTPFLALAQECLGRRVYGEDPQRAPRAKKITFCYGARAAEYLAGVADFERLGIEVLISTDDGSAGRRGFVTDVARETLQNSPHATLVCCGPEPMMEAVSHLGGALNIPCWASLENPMACGIGICFSCVAKVRQADGGWDYRRSCVEGPVFDAAQIVW